MTEPTIADYPCDICGEPAYHAAWDKVELPPIKDKHGNLWADYTGYGNAQIGCKKHPPSSVTHKLEDFTDDAREAILQHREATRAWSDSVISAAGSNPNAGNAGESLHRSV